MVHLVADLLKLFNLFGYARYLYTRSPFYSTRDQQAFCLPASLALSISDVGHLQYHTSVGGFAVVVCWERYME